MSKRPAVVLALLVTLVACNVDDDAAPDTTGPTRAATDPTTSEPVSITPLATDAPDTVPTTPPAPPTTPVEDLKAVIASEFEQSVVANYAGLVDPTLEALPKLLTDVVVPGSPSKASLTANVTELLQLGDGIGPGDPDILDITIEQVELVGAQPYTMALVTVCEVENRPQVTLSKNTSNGRVIEVEGSGDIQAIRSIYDVRLAPAGWRLWETVPDVGKVYTGRDACPPA